MLLEELKKEDDAIHARAKAKREAKKAKYFEQLRMKRKINVCFKYSVFLIL